MFCIDGYHIICLSLKKREIIIYAKEGIKTVYFDSPCIFCSARIILGQINKARLLLCLIYRSLNSPVDYAKRLCNLIHFFASQKKDEVIILGNFNFIPLTGQQRQHILSQHIPHYFFI